MRANLGRLWQGLDGEHRALARQLVRYAVSGLGVTLFQIAVYNVLAGPANLRPLIASTISYPAALLVGYIIHSRYSFEGHGTRGGHARTGFRFVAASLAGFVLNSFWVWLFTVRLHWKDWTPSLPWLFVTPLALFWINRRWVFD